jgi:hypothetical protein
MNGACHTRTDIQSNKAGAEKLVFALLVFSSCLMRALLDAFYLYVRVIFAHTQLRPLKFSAFEN